MRPSGVKARGSTKTVVCDDTQCKGAFVATQLRTWRFLCVDPSCETIACACALLLLMGLRFARACANGLECRDIATTQRKSPQLKRYCVCLFFNSQFEKYIFFPTASSPPGQVVRHERLLSISKTLRRWSPGCCLLHEREDRSTNRRYYSRLGYGHAQFGCDSWKAAMVEVCSSNQTY